MHYKEKTQCDQPKDFHGLTHTEEGQHSATHEEGQSASLAQSGQKIVDKELTVEELFLQLLEQFRDVPFRGGKHVPPRCGPGPTKFIA